MAKELVDNSTRAYRINMGTWDNATMTINPAEVDAGPAPQVEDAPSMVPEENAAQHATAADLIGVLHRGCERIVAFAIAPEGGSPSANKFAPVRLPEWIGVHSGHRNCYLTAALIHPSASVKKPSKADMVGSNALWVDIDPEGDDRFEPSRAEALAALRGAINPPSCIVDTGNGFQAYWFLKNPESDVAAIETRNKRLAQVFEADHCHSIDHLMRMPDTANLLNKKKVAKGYPPGSRMAHIVDWHPGRTYDLSQFEATQVDPAQDPKEKDAPGFTAKAEYRRIRPDDPALKALDAKWITLGLDGDTEGKYVGADGNTDRSRMAIAFATACQHAMISEDVIAAILLDPSWVVGECIRDKGGAIKRVLKRTIERSREFARSSKLGEMNEEHHVVKLGGKTLVLSWDYEDEMYPGRPIATYMSSAEFCKYHNKWEYVWSIDGETKRKDLGTWWWENGGRRQYAGVVYAPHVNEDTVGGKLNLWRGFSVEPKEGDCSLYLEHLRNNVCVDHAGRPHRQSYDYLLSWMAYAVQHPERQGQVAWVMLGKKGIGKTVAGEEFGKLFGLHYTAITNPDHMTGKFNAHLQACSVLLADECFFAGDRRHEQILKTLITGDTLFIEPKGINAYSVKNYLHIIMCTNNDWAVPAGNDERRYFVLKVGEKRMQDVRYFKALCDQMDGGGRAAFLYMLLNMDLSSFEVRRAPKTAALRDQQDRSRQGVDALVEEMLMTGHVLFAHHERPSLCLTSGEENGQGFDHYVRRQASPDLQRLGPIRVKAILKKEWGCKTWRGRIGNAIVYGIDFPPLQTVRTLFEERHGEVLWPGPEEQEWEFDPDSDVPSTADDGSVPF